MALAGRFKVAIYDNFLESFARIPRAQQKKVNAFIRKFRHDPTSAAINYEPIDSFIDKRLHTVRIDQAYRAIVRKPEQGNVYLLLWVDHHDDAMRWARNKKVEVHPNTGSLQVLSATDSKADNEAASGASSKTGSLDNPAPTSSADKTPPLFAGIADYELARLGVPANRLSEVMARIDVIHLDKWVRDLLHNAGYKYEVLWWQHGGKLAALWAQAEALGAGLDMPQGFFRDEWELVVLAQGCDCWEDYKAASRSGRGVRMSRAQRQEAWAVFEEYRHLLNKHSLREPEDALRDAARLVENGKIRVNLRSIVVDEAQDMSTNAFALLRAVIGQERPNDLFIVGDGHQRIYRKKVVLGRAGVNIRGRGRRLRINYRTTDEIRRYATALLEGVEFDDLDSGDDSTRGYRSLLHGNAPEVVLTDSFEAEVDAIAAWLEDVELRRCCLVSRTQKALQRMAQALSGRGIEVILVDAKTQIGDDKDGLRLATMHRVKGLEYDQMIIAGASGDMVPDGVTVGRSSDQAVRRDAEIMERALLYVAITRARKAVLITAHGSLTSWLPKPQQAP